MIVEPDQRRRRLCRRWLLAAGVSGSLSGLRTALASEQAPAGEAAHLLHRVQEAAQRQSYSGTYVVSAGGSLTSARIVHVCEGRDQYERIDALDGQARRLFRHNELVHVLWPKTHEAVVQLREAPGEFPSPPTAVSFPGALSLYELVSLGSDRVAGLEAAVYAFRPKDGLRFGQRWWVDRATQLLLRVDVLNERGDVLESAAFSELQLGAKTSGAQLLQQMQKLDGYKVQRPAQVRTSLDREGWVVRTAVPGFDSVGGVRRPLLLGTPQDLVVSASAAVAPGLPDSSKNVLQAVFSDGLTHVSLFIEPYNAELHRSESPVMMGATHALARRMGEWWITAVGDVPVTTLRQLVAAVERRKN